MCSGRSFNLLLRDLIELQSRGALGANMPLGKDTRKSLDRTAGDTRGDVGLLTDKGSLSGRSRFSARRSRGRART